MKTTLPIAFAAVSMQLSAQCNIAGPSSINVSEETAYIIPNEIAQCKDCHLWVALGSDFLISGDNRQNSVKVKATNGGRKILSATVLTSKGILQCCKNIDVLIATSGTPSSNSSITTSSTASQNSQPACDVKVDNFKEVKYDEGIVTFFPNSNDASYIYNWTISYDNGETKTSNEKIPQFSYSAENGIKTVRVKIISAKCYKDYSKTYDSNFWKYFK